MFPPQSKQAYTERNGEKRSVEPLYYVRTARYIHTIIRVLGTQYQFLQWLGFIFCPQNFDKKILPTSFAMLFCSLNIGIYTPQVLGTITITVPTQKYTYWSDPKTLFVFVIHKHLPE